MYTIDTNYVGTGSRFIHDAHPKAKHNMPRSEKYIQKKAVYKSIEHGSKDLVCTMVTCTMQKQHAIRFLRMHSATPSTKLIQRAKETLSVGLYNNITPKNFAASQHVTARKIRLDERALF